MYFSLDRGHHLANAYVLHDFIIIIFFRITLSRYGIVDISCRDHVISSLGDDDNRLLNVPKNCQSEIYPFKLSLIESMFV